MIKILRNTSIIFNYRPLCNFSNDKMKYDNKYKSLFNPKGEKDLRGHQNLDKLSDLQKSYSPLHNSDQSKDNIFTLYKFFCRLPPRLINFLKRHFNSQEITIASDNLHLPKIVSGGIPVYDSFYYTSTVALMNKVLIYVAPILVISSTNILLNALFLGGCYTMFYFGRWKIMKDIALRVQLCPQTEEIIYQKVSIFGQIITSKSKIQDLQHIKLEQFFGEQNISLQSTRGLINTEVAFRDVNTKQLLLFDHKGLWHQQGVNHTLLV